MEFKFELIDLFLVSPIIALFLASIVPITVKVLRGNREQSSLATASYGVIGLVAALGLILAFANVERLAFSKALSFDGLSTISSLLVVCITAVALFFSRENIASVTRQFSEYVFLLLNAAIGMLVVGWANDLIVLFIGIEYMSLCLYILIAISFEERLSKEAAFKYFILGSFASAIMLFGISFLYGSVGNTYLSEIMSVAPDLILVNVLFRFGVAMLVVGLLFKIAAFPFHAWAPDVYQGAATPIAAFMATGVKLVSFIAFLRIIGTNVLISDKGEGLLYALEWIAVLTMLAGNFAALVQNNLKRVLAYSGIAHSGYAMVGVIAAGLGGQSILGASGVVYYLIAYSIMTLGAFGVVSLMEKREDSMINVDDLQGMGRRNPVMALILSIFLLSLAGIPPTIGFFGKFFIFSAAIKQGLFWLAIWGVLNSVISVYYYLRPIVVMYMRDEEGVDIVAGRPLTQTAVMVMALLVVILGLVPSPIYQAVAGSLAGLF